MEDEIKKAAALGEGDLARIIIAMSDPSPESALLETAMGVFGVGQNELAACAVRMLEKAGFIARPLYAVADMVEAPSAFISMYRLTTKGVELREKYLR